MVPVCNGEAYTLPDISQQKRLSVERLKHTELFCDHEDQYQEVCDNNCLPVPRIVENRESVKQKVWIEGLMADSYPLKDCKEYMETREEKIK